MSSSEMEVENKENNFSAKALKVIDTFSLPEDYIYPCLLNNSKKKIFFLTLCKVKPERSNSSILIIENSMSFLIICEFFRHADSWLTLNDVDSRVNQQIYRDITGVYRKDIASNYVRFIRLGTNCEINKLKHKGALIQNKDNKKYYKLNKYTEFNIYTKK